MKTFSLRLLVSAVLLFTLDFNGYAQQRGAGGAGQNQPPAGPPPILAKISDDLHVIQNAVHEVSHIGAFGGNVTVYLTNDGVILVDSKNDRMHDDIVAKVKSLTDKPIKYVILTHNHADHSGGAAKMNSIGATVIISANDRDNMARNPNQSQGWLPELTYTGHAKIVLGGKEVRLREFRGHTRGDTVVHFPGARVVTMGDLLTTHENIPNIVNYGDGGNWTDWRTTIDEILTMDFDRVIPGHGPPITKKELVAIRDKMVAVQERVRALNRERKTQEEITQTLVKEFNWGAGPSAGNIPGMMQELR
jgi:glyoxylase-like metal-dependent hydrolase (beta-lactamase superfamily II)